MPGTYFSNFPVISYANNQCINITERATLLNKVYSNPYLYYQYDVVAGERPDNISARYYGDPYMSWLLYFSNATVDPYYGWYMDQTTFEDYLISKYGSLINAQSKIAFYRNNWYSNSDSITTDTYNSLDPDLQKFYEPNFGNDLYGVNPLNYIRIQKDWTLKTNSVVNYTVNTTDTFNIDEIVDIYHNGVMVGYAQVTYSGFMQVTVQHTNGIVVESVSGDCHLYGRESNITVSFTASVVIATPMPTIELNYWSPVTYYDYENELNEQNKSIRVLNSRYSGQLIKQLGDLL